MQATHIEDIAKIDAEARERLKDVTLGDRHIYRRIGKELMAELGDMAKQRGVKRIDLIAAGAELVAMLGRCEAQGIQGPSIPFLVKMARRQYPNSQTEGSN